MNDTHKLQDETLAAWVARLIFHNYNITPDVFRSSGWPRVVIKLAHFSDNFDFLLGLQRGGKALIKTQVVDGVDLEYHIVFENEYDCDELAAKIICSKLQE